MTTCKKLEKVLEHLEKNPFFEKYSNKIAKLQQTKSNEFLQRAENQEKLQKAKEKWEEEQKFYQSQAKPNLGENQQPRQAQLNNIMKVDMIQDKTKDEIINIWKDYHKDKNYICGILTPDQFDKMFENGKHYPTFLLPLPRKQGYEFIVTQFYGLEIHMTPLLWYQAHKENAPECLTMIHYTEFRDNKEIILMRGEYDEKCINGQEAQCLVNELQLYYCANNAKRLQLLETFTNKPDKFKYMDLVAQLESIQLVL
ncbi:ATP synthase mitochondrial F1 complex assembly factor 1, partial [Eufriesea mexicana]